jgi:hypothetical protein
MWIREHDAQPLLRRSPGHREANDAAADDGDVVLGLGLSDHGRLPSPA